LPDDRSGVFIVQNVQQKIVALWAGVYQARSRHEQLEEIRERFPNADEKNCRALLEKDSRCRVHLERTPQGVPVVLSKRGARILSYKKLRAFQDEHQVKAFAIPRSFLESLAESEHNQPWTRLAVKQKLPLLDAVVCLYRSCAHEPTVKSANRMEAA
jgi:hypothetical protein